MWGGSADDVSNGPLVRLFVAVVTMGVVAASSSGGGGLAKWWSERGTFLVGFVVGFVVVGTAGIVGIVGKDSAA